ncbi:MAG: hypothetical protein Q8N81_02390, partial [bacterium]|nr:hypothetical protein [bacterium]
GPSVATASDTARVNVTIAPPQNCTLYVRATLNGAAWSGSLNYSASGPTSVSDSTVPKDFTVNAGTYVANYISGGPSGTFTGISPSSGNCPAGGSLTFTYNFTRVDVRDLTIDKQVKNVTVGTAYSDSVTAQPSQIVEYKIEIRNTGNATIDALLSKDILPQKMSFISGSMTVNGSASSNEACFISFSGCSFGPLLASESKIIIFRGQLAGTNEFPVGNTALINTAYAWSSNIAEKTDIATVNVNKNLVKENGSAANRPQ